VSVPPRVRAYLAAYRLQRRLRRAPGPVLAGVWLGMMDEDALHALDDAFYARSATYRSDPHNLRGLFPWEEEAVGAFFGGRGALLVLGAGGGREVLALARRGFGVEGFECNPALVDYAASLLAREGVGSRVHLLPRDAVPDAGRFDGAVVGWSAYMLIAGRARRIALLRGLRERLDAGSPVLLSFWTRRPGSLRARRVAAVAGRIRRLLGGEPVEEGDDLAPNFVHRFTRDEIEAELAAAGYRLARFVPETGAYDSGWAVGILDG
jgi:hypothetical protein